MTVPESYLRRLESEIAQLRQPVRPDQRVLTGVNLDPRTPSSKGLEEDDLPCRLIENSTTEHFIRKLKHVYSAQRPRITVGSPSSTGHTPDQANHSDMERQSATSDYTYVPLESDNNSM